MHNRCFQKLLCVAVGTALCSLLVQSLWNQALLPAKAAVLRGSCGDGVTWALEDGERLTLYGSGTTYDYPLSDDAPWQDSVATITTIVVGSGVTQLGAYLFADLPALSQVTLPETLTEICNSAFTGAVGLQSVVLPTSLKAIDEYAFYQSGLETVSLPAKVQSIGLEAFGRCLRLTDFTVNPENAHFSVTDGLLLNADGTRLVRYPIGKPETAWTVPESIAAIGPAACADAGFQTVTIPANVKTISAQGFSWCTNLKTVQFSPGLASVGDRAFAGCTALTALLFPNSLQSLGQSVTANCSSFTTVKLPFLLRAVYPSTFDSQRLTTIYSYCNTYPALFAAYYGYRLRLFGDMDYNGCIDSNDALQVLSAYSSSLLGKDGLSTEECLLEDVNCDGQINPNDAVLLLRYYSVAMLGAADWSKLLAG